jgi:outer membrane protein assembly factor BamB
MILGAAVMVMALGGTAHADVTVGIDAQDGDIIWSLPTPPDGVEYPSEIQTVVTGTAGFSSTDGSVLFAFSVDADQGPIVVYSGQADLAPAGCSSECTWSFKVPFLLPPSEYDITVKASEPNVVNPEEPGPSATDSVHVVLI